KSVTLNLKAREGLDILRSLARKSDVVVENFRPGTMERLGVGFKALSRLNPRLVYCSISGFGESGPEAHRAGYDLIVQGEGGVMDNALWRQCAAALARPDPVAERRFDTEAKRVEHRATLVPLLNEIFGARGADEWLKRLEAAGVPAGRIKTVAEVCESDHLKS